MTDLTTGLAARNRLIADRAFFIASLRSASLQYKLWASELDMLGVALTNDAMSLGTAVEWAADIGMLEYLPPTFDSEVCA